MIAIYFFYGLAFWALGHAAWLQTGRDVQIPLRRQIPLLAAFGFTAGLTGWVEMFLLVDLPGEVGAILKTAGTLLQPITGLLLLAFGWRVLTKLSPLPPWSFFIPGVLVVPLSFVVAYASTTFITPSPIEIPIDIWSRYLLYLPGSIMAGVGFLRQWKEQQQAGYPDVAKLMLGAGMAFLVEAVVMGLVVPAAPYGPASYYNYNRVIKNAFVGENMSTLSPYGLSAWLDYNRVLEITGFPIQFWRMLSAFLVTFFVSRGLDVFDATLRRQLLALQRERDRANEVSLQTQRAARLTAEGWTNALLSISRRISELADVDHILLYIVDTSRRLLDSDFIGLALLDGESDQLQLCCYSTETETELAKAPVTNPLILQAMLSGRAYRSVENESSRALEGARLFPDQAAQALAVVVLRLDNQSIGTLWMARIQDRPYTENEVIWLEALADQVDIAIHHGIMTSQLQMLTVTEERNRIAREMHDSLAQILGYLNLQIQTLEVMHQQGNAAGLEREFQKMRAEVQAAHADVRENILSLRTTLANEKGLIAAIEEYLKEFSYQTGIKTHFENAAPADHALSAMAEIQLVCIMQEALANVRKHAQARHVSIGLNLIGDEVNPAIEMCIEDDGVGFQIGEHKGHFGLVTMQERARGVDGQIRVQSTPGRGVRVVCRLPCLRQEGLFKRSLDSQVVSHEYS